MEDNYEYENNSFFDDSSNFDNSEFYESDSDASFDEKYEIPVDITKFPNYHINDLQPNIVYYEVVRKPDGTYFYINNPFKGTMKNGRLVYENKHSDKIIESINRLRNPIRLMNEEDKMKTVKYLQNLCKLSNSYICV